MEESYLFRIDTLGLRITIESFLPILVPTRFPNQLLTYVTY